MLSIHNTENSAAGAGSNSHPLGQQCHRGETALKLLTLYTLSAKVMDSLQPHVQNQLVATGYLRGRQAAWGDSSGFTESNWHCLWRLHCRELLHLHASQKVVASLTVTGFPHRSLHPKAELPDQSLFSTKYWHPSSPREKTSVQARNYSVLKSYF